MPLTCCVPNCRTGYKSEGKRESIPLFSTSNTDLLVKWSKAIPRKDYVFTKSSKVCRNHFDDSDIVEGYTMSVEGEPTFVPYKKLRLKPDAVPCIFKNCPAYLSSNLKKRKCPKERLDITPRPSKKPNLAHCSTTVSMDTEQPIEPARSVDIEAIEMEPAVAINISSTTTSICETAIQENACWETELKNICLPPLWAYQKIGANSFSFFQTEILNGTIKIIKGITINQNCLSYSVNAKSYKPQYFPRTVATAIELAQVIQKFAEAEICQGVSIPDNLKLTCKLLESDKYYKEVQSSNRWNSYQCEMLLFHSTVQEKSKSLIVQMQSCGCCQKLKAFVWKWMWKEKNQSCGKIARCRMTIKNSKRTLSRKLTKLNRLSSEITALQKSTKITCKKAFEEYLSELSEKVFTLHPKT